MNRIRAAVLIVSVALIAAVAVVALMAASGSDESASVLASGKPTLTPTPGPPPTPKPEDTGPLSGIFDVQVPLPLPGGSPEGAGTCNDGLDNDGDWAIDIEDPDCQDKSFSLYNCITRQDHDALTNEVKTSNQCYVDNTGLDDPTDIMPTKPGEGPDMIPGPPPPPPYTSGVPMKGNGILQKDELGPGKDLLVLTQCFAANGNNGNIIARVTFRNPLGQEAVPPLGTTGGMLELFLGQSDEWCDTKMPSGDPDAVLPIQTTRVTPPDRDYDEDGCTDSQELDKTGAFKCGDDPWNSYDGPLYTDAPSGMTGNYSMTAEVLEADYDKVLDQPIPGAYYQCLSHMVEDPDNILNAKIFCYIDIPGVPVNPEAGPESGDGLSGGMPPKPYADVPNTEHTKLTGYIDPVKNTLEMWGCFWDEDGTGPLGNVIVRTHWLDLHTLQGHVWIWVFQDKADCHAIKDTGEWVEPAGDPVLAELAMVNQGAKVDEERDTDLDGCSNKSELQDNPSAGGLRDPYNHWDYFNPTKDGLNRVDDILKVVGQYFCDNGTCPTYTRSTDRTAVIGANPWNLNQPNGQQRVDDILGAVKSYFHDCSDGKNLSDDDAQFDYVKLK